MTSPRKKNDHTVFVSFRGTDTRFNFTDHLFGALQRKRIFTFRDDTNLQKGNSIASDLIQAIEGSQVFIVVFSKNYASSTWCLRELAYILNCSVLYGKRVLPVFYDVDLSEVRKQSGGYGESFNYHGKRFQDHSNMVQRRRETLQLVGNISGWDLRDKPHHAELENIIEHINILGCKFPSRTKDLVEINYDVFVSFRGPDTRFNFTDHFCAALQRRGINAFRDDTKLKKGEFIAPGLFRAIEASQVYIVVFSKNYASSTWCLRELEYILHCSKKHGKHVLPVFYDVDPSEVQKQSGGYGDALSKHGLNMV
ncbi:putative TIR domain-containing protein [Medicago truncatula]|uniref:ADP-ribosyl cyclase/cyclic ADP-ribose hydrolase n=1 Tax=Medicago truncatula TaxID=3880 RepID=G7KHR1_MEDTR|nr:disease resistance protein RUN1 [Medicago truncatula]AES75283.1 disease resistance protein (TIR-NBS-LRR class) [Medicago truncatula]RHN51033.1 putative TIR domain-containing protein [Medicago truncatula]